jgi:hypothetical protein
MLSYLVVYTPVNGRVDASIPDLPGVHVNSATRLDAEYDLRIAVFKHLMGVAVADYPTTPSTIGRIEM